MGNKAAPLVFTGAAESAAGSFRRGWPVLFAPAAESVGGVIFIAGANSVGGANSTAGVLSVGGAVVEAGAVSVGGSEFAGAILRVEGDCCSFSSCARRSFSNRKIAAKPPVFGLRLLLIFRLTINFKSHFGIGSVDHVYGYALHAGEFSHLK